MRIRSAGIVCACALVSGLLVADANAQLVVGSTSTVAGTPAAYYVDVTTGVQTPLWTQTAQTNVNGLGGDNVNGKLYSNDAARLNVWNYGAVGTTPTFIAGTYRTDGAGSFAASGVDSLTFVNGKLYGAISSSVLAFNQFRGIYEIATQHDGAATPHCIMTPVYMNSFGTMNLGGLDFDPALGEFVVTSTVDATSNGGPGIGIYAIDALGDDSVTKIADFPAGETDWDGLAIGGGKYWLTDYQVGTPTVIKILPYDPTTATYGTMMTVSLTDGTNRATGATWAPNALPEPSSLAAVGFMSLVFARRRRGN
jgi:hypothetical protein